MQITHLWYLASGSMLNFEFQICFTILLDARNKRKKLKSKFIITSMTALAPRLYLKNNPIFFLPCSDLDLGLNLKYVW